MLYEPQVDPRNGGLTQLVGANTVLLSGRSLIISHNQDR